MESQRAFGGGVHESDSTRTPGSGTLPDHLASFADHVDVLRGYSCISERVKSCLLTNKRAAPSNFWSPNVRSGGWLVVFEQRRDLFGGGAQHEGGFPVLQSGHFEPQSFAGPVGFGNALFAGFTERHTG